MWAVPGLYPRLQSLCGTVWQKPASSPSCVLVYSTYHLYDVTLCMSPLSALSGRISS